MPSGRGASDVEELKPLKEEGPTQSHQHWAHVRVLAPVLGFAVLGICLMLLPRRLASRGDGFLSPSELDLSGADDIELPKQVILRSFHGKYVAAEEETGALVADRPWADDWEKFEVVTKADGIIALKSFHGRFVSADATGKLEVTASTTDFQNTSFQAQSVDSGVVFKTAFGTYVTADADGNMQADSSIPSDWAFFTIVDVADSWPVHVAVKTIFGKYLRGTAEGGVAADGVWPLDSWKKFRVVLDDGGVSLQFDHGEYLTVQPDGSLHLSEELSSSEKFSVTHLHDGNFTVQDHTGRFVWAGQDGTIKAENSASVGESEKLQVVFLP